MSYVESSHALNIGYRQENLDIISTIAKVKIILQVANWFIVLSYLVVTIPCPIRDH